MPLVTLIFWTMLTTNIPARYVISVWLHNLYTPGGRTSICRPISSACQKTPPPSYANLTTNDPVFYYSPHPMTPFFQYFNVIFPIFFLHFTRISKNLSIFSYKWQIFTKIWQNWHQWEIYSKKFVMLTISQWNPNSHRKYTHRYFTLHFET